MELAVHSFVAGRCNRLLDWLYPPRCRGCGARLRSAEREYFCPPCWKKIQLVRHPMCTLCGRPFLQASGADHACGACLARPPQFERAWAWACYPAQGGEPDPMREAVHQFKYGRKVSLGKTLGRLMARGCRDFLEDCEADIIMPVPLHPKRLRWRGFNQAALLARQVSRAYAVPLDPFTLKRTRATQPQTQLNEPERRRNVRGAFAVRTASALEGKKVLLVDDIYTSGATVNECSRTLKKGGAATVYVLTLAHAN